MPRNATAAALVLAIAVAGAGCDDRGGDLEAYCTTARDFLDDNPAATFALVDPTDPTATAAALRSASDRLREWSVEAPSDIDQDVEVLADGAEALAVGFESGTTATPEEQAATTEALASASDAVLRYTSEHCDVDLDPAATTAVP